MQLHRALWALDPERAHGLGLALLNLLPRQRLSPSPRLRTRLAGLDLAHPIGLAAGFDKDAKAISGFGKLGFAFLEVGTVTPLPQPGNSRPRLFRLTEDRAIINRMGFNNEGAEAMAARLARLGSRAVPIGVNIGMNKASSEALPDYLLGLERFAALADYITLNVSSPNTPGLRALQQIDRLRALLTPVLSRRDAMAAGGRRRLPIFLKIAPDLEREQAQAIAALAIELSVDALLISNTTVARPESLRSPARGEAGGLSGSPLMGPSTELLRQVYRQTRDRLPLVGIGGIFSAADILAKLRAGASAVQLYSSLIYEGPGLVRRLVRDLDRLLARDGVDRLEQVIGIDA